ncbi:hypothetical protein K456DRAFT_549004 [Colletotrichum gloeosporioides 23]|nr:hypothetical protein K456DRAFT_549004 [Colletotrichum gloeosporioides 23]
MTRGCVSLGWLPVLQLLENPSSRPLEFALLVARSCRREDDNCLVFLSRMPTMGLGPSLQQIEPNEVQLTQHGSAPHYKHLGLGCCEKVHAEMANGMGASFLLTEAAHHYPLGSLASVSSERRDIWLAHVFNSVPALLTFVPCSDEQHCNQWDEEAAEEDRGKGQ